ncbi:hypothetical protein PAAG_02863 [Paracoccidioides lutzii Pb01]|uniref:Uncharacterized protein n=1 Tax=Paracoccidioides lutzii (strain ATCC MYA-826 / Pb01) TaxID=502779 RepID=C1GWG8_PARBA|nr:hypothetical protein PAAG_02863 [Paracoccidioides lutzii Pb01]EEH40887.2 hypothetical protein PAAG_02863 [Paracoccidioides lutzii Pb01]
MTFQKKGKDPSSKDAWQRIYGETPVTVKEAHLEWVFKPQLQFRNREIRYFRRKDIFHKQAFIEIELHMLGKIGSSTGQPHKGWACAGVSAGGNVKWIREPPALSGLPLIIGPKGSSPLKTHVRDLRYARPHFPGGRRTLAPNLLKQTRWLFANPDTPQKASTKALLARVAPKLQGAFDGVGNRA